MSNDDLLETGEGEPAPAIPNAATRTRGAAAPVRSAVRTAAPESEGREPARKRTRQRLGTVDKFHIAADRIPPGMAYEWKRYEVLGQHDHSYSQSLSENGWDPVDASRHPDLMPPGHKGAIIRDGLMLMERPVELSEEAKAEDYQMARDQVRVNEAKMADTPHGTMTRDHATARPRVGRSYEAMAIPD